LQRARPPSSSRSELSLQLTTGMAPTSDSPTTRSSASTDTTSTTRKCPTGFRARQLSNGWVNADTARAAIRIGLYARLDEFVKARLRDVARCRSRIEKTVLRHVHWWPQRRWHRCNFTKIYGVSLCDKPPREFIGVNATGDAGDASPVIFGQLGTKFLISPKVCQNCCNIACRTDAYGATSVCCSNKTPRQSKRE